MTTNPARRIIAALTAMPWAMTEDALRLMLAIAERTQYDPAAVEARKAERLAQTASAGLRDGVAVIPVIGPIARRMNMFSDVSGGTSLDLLARDFVTALDNNQVRAIVLNIDSPGGEANGVSEFANMVYSARGRKPIYAYVGGMGASAAYWIASAAEKIVIDDTAMLGSIGVIAAVPTSEEDDEVTFVSSQSPNKRPDPKTEEGAASIQSMIDSLAQVFVESIARNRGVSAETVLTSFGQGGMFVGKDAVKARLADSVGSFEGVLTQLAQARPPQPTMQMQTAAALPAYEPSAIPIAASAGGFPAAPLLPLAPPAPVSQARADTPTFQQQPMEVLMSDPTLEQAPLPNVPAPTPAAPPPAPSLPPINDAALQARLDAYFAQNQAYMQQRERQIEQRLQSDFERRMLELDQRNSIETFARTHTVTAPDRPLALSCPPNELAALLLETPASVRGKWMALIASVTRGDGTVSFDEIGSSGESAEAADRWGILVNAKVAAGLSKVDAIKAVGREHPDLYDAQTRTVRKGGR